MPVRDSPFPGMDPYLQRRWGYVRSTLVPSINESLQETPSPPLPPADAAWADELLRAAGRRP